MKIALLASGRGSNAVALVDTVQESDMNADIVGLVSNRGAAPVLQRMAERGVATRCVRSPRARGVAALDAALLEALGPWQPDVLVLVGFMRLVGPDLLTPYSGRVLNIHPSLLPHFPGLNTHQRALDAGHSRHGCSVHVVTNELDAGPILGQAEVPVLPGDSADELASRVLTLEHKLLPQVVATIAEGSILLKPEGPVFLQDGPLRILDPDLNP